jgi:hypothetical protein
MEVKIKPCSKQKESHKIAKTDIFPRKGEISPPKELEDRILSRKINMYVLNKANPIDHDTNLEGSSIFQKMKESDQSSDYSTNICGNKTKCDTRLRFIID